MAEIAPPPQATNISGAEGVTDPAWFQWFQEVWDKSRQGFQSLVSQEISSDDSLEFLLTGPSAGFKDYKIVLNNVLVTQPDTLIYVQVSTDGGSSYKSGNADYSWVLSLSGNISFKEYDNEDSQMQLVPLGVGNASTNIVTGEIIFYDLAGDAALKFLRWDLRYKDADGDITLVRGAGSYNDSGDIDGIRFYPSQGAFSEGTLEIFGSK